MSQFPYAFKKTYRVGLLSAAALGLATASLHAAPIFSDPINFFDAAPSGFNVAQNVSNDFAVSTDVSTGDTLTLNNNTWLKINLGGYAVNANTILEFDLTSSGQEAEIVAIGFQNNTLESAARHIRFGGTEVWGNAYHPPIQVGETRTIRVNVGHYIPNATYTYMTFIRDDDATTAGTVEFSNVRVFQATPNPAPNINWDTYPLASFANQNVTNSIVEGGHESRRQSVALGGNTWAQIDLTNYNITANTVLTFDFLSTGSAPETLGVGFYSTLSPTGARTIQIGGTQSYGVSFTPQAVQGTFTSFEIPVGSLIGLGDFRYLVFARDADLPAPGTAYFSNINLVEGVAPPAPVTPSTDPIDFGDHTVLSHFGTVQFVNSNDVEPGAFSTSGTEITFTGNTWKVLELDYFVTSNSIIEFEFRSTGTDPEIAGFSLDNPSFSASLGDNVPAVRSRTVQLLGSQSFGEVPVDPYTGGGAWQQYAMPLLDITSPGGNKYLMFISDDDALSGTTNFSFRNIRIYELGNIAPGALQLDAIGPFSVPGQDVNSADFNFLEGGTAISFTGNTWKAFEVNKVIGPTTVLHLTFQSNGVDPEVSGIMVSNPGISVNANRTVQFFGTQTFGTHTATTYTGAGVPQTYAIPIGTFVTAGTYKFLSLINDADLVTGTNVKYRNIHWEN